MLCCLFLAYQMIKTVTNLLCDLVPWFQTVQLNVYKLPLTSIVVVG